MRPIAGPDAGGERKARASADVASPAPSGCDVRCKEEGELNGIGIEGVEVVDEG